MAWKRSNKKKYDDIEINVVICVDDEEKICEIF